MMPMGVVEKSGQMMGLTRVTDLLGSALLFLGLHNGRHAETMLM